MRKQFYVFIYLVEMQPINNKHLSTYRFNLFAFLSLNLVTVLVTDLLVVQSNIE